jgi:hypothetical protein
MIDESNSLVKRFQETILRLAQDRKRALDSPVEEHEDNTRTALRRLAQRRISLVLRQLRAAHGLSYAQIQTQTGFSQQFLFDIEYKDHRLTLDELRILANCYGVHVNDLLGVDIE